MSQGFEASPREIGNSIPVDQVLDSWVAAQLAPWKPVASTLPDPRNFFSPLNDARSDLFVFIIGGGKVAIAPKPRHYSAEQMQSGSTEFIRRAAHYRNFFATVVREHCPELDCVLGMSMDDTGLESPAIPTFAFQKRRGSRVLLLPDIDALIHKFYVGVEDDGTAYLDKLNAAVFVGSTTGEIHSQASVARLSNQRLKLGVFYRDRSDVIFRLPNITQCDSPDTEQAIRALGFGSGAMTWQQQLGYRFLISVDGNGATCSRVALALKSNSALLKFKSEHVLHYFDGLVENRHFITIDEPDDVIAIIEAEKASPGRYAEVARAGTQFYQRYLTRAPSLRYTARLLRRYAALFGAAPNSAYDPLAKPAGAAVLPTGSPEVQAVCVAHVRDRGDVVFDLHSWIGDVDGLSLIEGFQLRFEAGLTPGSLRCRILTETNTAWTDQPDGTFVGSRSRSEGVIGMAFELTGHAAQRYDVYYACRFIDDSQSPARRNGHACVSESAKPVKAFRLAFTPRSIERQ
jgi:hypothetical protein